MPHDDVIPKVPKTASNVAVHSNDQAGLDVTEGIDADDDEAPIRTNQVLTHNRSTYLLFFLCILFTVVFHICKE